MKASRLPLREVRENAHPILGFYGRRKLPTCPEEHSTSIDPEVGWGLAYHGFVSLPLSCPTGPVDFLREYIPATS